MNVYGKESSDSLPLLTSNHKKIVKPHLTANYTTQVFYRKFWDVGRTLQKFENHEPDSQTFLKFSQHPVWGITTVNR